MVGIVFNEPQSVEAAVAATVQTTSAKITSFTVQAPPVGFGDVRLHVEWVLYAPGANEGDPDQLYARDDVWIEGADLPGLLYAPVSGIAVEEVYRLLYTYLITKGLLPAGTVES